MKADLSRVRLDVGPRLAPTRAILVLALSLAAVRPCALAAINSWRNVGFEGIQVSAIAIDPRNPDTIYAGRGDVVGSRVMVFKTTDRGANWSETGPGLPAIPAPLGNWNKITAIAIDPKNPDTVYIAMRSSYTLNEGFVFKSTDGGASWSSASRGLRTDPLSAITDLVLDPHNPATLYLGTHGAGIFKTTDAAANWSLTGTGLPLSGTAFIPYTCLALDPQNPETVFAGIYGLGIYKTTDAGINWNAAATKLPAVSVIRVDPLDSNIVYAGTANYCGCAEDPSPAGIWKSIDGGVTWQPTNSGWPAPFTPVYSLAIDLVNHRKLYAATHDDVYESRDGGMSWSRVGEGLGLGSAGIPALIIAQGDPATILAGTRSGVFEFSLREPRLANLSTLAWVGSGADMLTAGFVIGGATPKQVVIRAVGPTLATTPFNIPATLADPQITLFGPNSSTMVAARNDNWVASDAPVFASIGAFSFSPGSRDAAIRATLPPGSYSVQVSGAGGTTGTAILEIYEADATNGKLLNLSTRARTTEAVGMLTSGFVVTPGDGTRKLLIRAAGPTLQLLNVPDALANPTLTLLRDGSPPTVVAANDDWGTPNGTNAASATVLAAAFAQAGAFAFPSGSNDAAVLVDVAPGNYNVQVAGTDGTSGVTVVEVYDLTPSELP